MTMRRTALLAAGLAVAIGAGTIAESADARHRHWRHHHGHDHDIDAFGAGVIGFAAGTFFGAAVSQPRYYGPRRYAPAYPYYYAYPPIVTAPDASREGGDARD
jgi:hypothetical protein